MPGVYTRETLPKEGAIYTVREIVDCIRLYGFDEDGLRLIEIINAPGRYTTLSGRVETELAFRMSRFRPLRATSIEVFQRMLEPVPVVEVEPA